MVYKDTPKAYLPYHDWEAAPVQADISWRDNADRKKLPRVEIAHKVGSRIYTCNGAMYGGIDESYKELYELIPLSQYDGPTYDVPAHDGMSYMENEQAMPDGAVRHRGDNRGSLALVDGRKFVFGSKLKLCPLIPDTAAMVSMVMAKNYVFKERSCYCQYQGMAAWETTKPVFGVCEDVTFYEFEANGSFHRMGLYIDKSGQVSERPIDDLEALVELRAIESEMFNSMRTKPSPRQEQQMGLF